MEEIPKDLTVNQREAIYNYFNNPETKRIERLTLENLINDFREINDFKLSYPEVPSPYETVLFEEMGYTPKKTTQT